MAEQMQGNADVPSRRGDRADNSGEGTFRTARPRWRVQCASRTMVGGSQEHKKPDHARVSHYGDQEFRAGEWSEVLPV